MQISSHYVIPFKWAEDLNRHFPKENVILNISIVKKHVISRRFNQDGVIPGTSVHVCSWELLLMAPGTGQPCLY